MRDDCDTVIAADNIDDFFHRRIVDFDIARFPLRIIIPIKIYIWVIASFPSGTVWF